jgi:hypothetical protein
LSYALSSSPTKESEGAGVKLRVKVQQKRVEGLELSSELKYNKREWRGWS